MWCFEHCSKTTVVTNFMVTNTTKCPACLQNNLSNFNLHPFTIPCPLRDAFEGQGAAMVIAVPGGKRTPDVSRMHVGLTDARGRRVVHFDRNGLEIHPRGHSQWSNCLVSKQHLGVKIINRGSTTPKIIDFSSSNPISSLWEQSSSELLSLSEQNQYWDQCLLRAMGRWQNRVYDEQNRDCLDFAIDFAKMFLQNHRKLDRLNFVQEFVLPMTQRLAWYLKLAERLEHEDHYIIV